MPVSKYALIGLNKDERIVWCSDDEHPRPVDRLLGASLEEVFPQLVRPLESGKWVQLGTNQGSCRALDMRGDAEADTDGIAWLLQFTPSILGARVSEATKTARLIQDARSELMTELHQSGQQVLSALLLRLGAMGERADEKEMQEIRALASSAQTEIRSLTRTVVPPALATAGLGSALGVLSETLRERGGFTLMVPTDRGQRFAEVIEICAYEAVRGLLAQVSTLGLERASASLHATASTLRIVIELDILASPTQLAPTDYVRALLARNRGSFTSEVGSEETTVVIEFPLGEEP